MTPETSWLESTSVSGVACEGTLDVSNTGPRPGSSNLSC